MKPLWALWFALFATTANALPNVGYYYNRNSKSSNSNNNNNNNNDSKENSIFFKDTNNNYKNSKSIFKDNSRLFKDTKNLFKDTNSLFKDTNSFFKDTTDRYKVSSSIFNPPTTGINTLTSNRQQYEKNTQQHQTEQSYSGNKYLPPETPAQEAIITKQFYVISAPEDDDDVPKTKHLVLGRPQKNYRVVFIRAPSSDSTNVKLTAEYAPQEEKTVIYVLSKKGNEVEVGDIATPAPTQPTKPEVFFIKYKTHEEAAAAQKEIQEHYDHLGGTSELTDEGVAPVSSVIGSLNGLAPDGGYDYRKGGASTAVKDILQQGRFYF